MRCRAAARPIAILLGAAAWACGSPRTPVRDEARTAAARTPLPKTNLSIADRARWYPVLGWPDSCEEAFQASHAGQDAGMIFHQLSPGMWLVEVLCAAGSYQPTFVVVRFDERAPTPAAAVLAFDTYRSLDGVSVERVTEMELAGESRVSPDRGELTVLTFARQTRDCGIWTRYAMTAEEPELEEARARLPCPDAPGTPVLSGPDAPPAGWRPVTADSKG